MIRCENLVKIFKVSDQEVFALQGLDLQVEQGEMMALIGNSGSGKSTLMNILGGLDRPTAGRVLVDNQDLLRCTDKELMRYKRHKVGFVWQNNAQNLIPYLTALQNVQIPMLLGAKPKRTRAKELLERVGLSSKMHHRLAELSGGEQQRVAIAIALSNDSRLLLADEPTGNVDSNNAAMILDIFRSLNQELGLTVVIVTHDMSLAKKVDRIVAIRDGKTSSEILRVPLRRDTSGSIRFESSSESGQRETSVAQSTEVLDAETTEDEEDSHIEYAVLDSAGRIQIPTNCLSELGMNGANKLRVSVEDGRIILTPP